MIVAAAGNESADLQHPAVDTISPDWPPDTAVERVVHNNCRVAPAEIPGVLAVSATGPTEIASYSSVGMNAVGVAAPGGDYFAATGTVQDAVLAAWTSTGEDGFWEFLDSLPFPGLTALDGGAATRRSPARRWPRRMPRASLRSCASSIRAGARRP